MKKLILKLAKQTKVELVAIALLALVICAIIAIGFLTLLGGRTR